ncbi:MULTISPECIES: ester cyclase [Streptomyces]|uniref:Ester cyclase n=1 Tax=Streptomyces eurythermus TaxID=42237 RepID=A0ABW6Z4W8_9ACTN|nr:MULTISPECIES: ester cyclase [Streptomyces]QIS74047.1 ester cyclase [Streptomyces sp. DSM 40868]WDM16595.1 ester cyclase [Streptomyces lavenduligriseus]
MSNDALALATEMGKVFNDLDEEAALTYIGAEFVDHEAPPGTPGGPLGYLGTARWVHSAFEGAKWEHLDSFAEGDRAVLRLRFTGRHVGDFLGIEPTQRPVDVEQTHIYRVENGLVVEHWGYRQDLLMLSQLGAITLQAPTPAA